MRIVSAGKLLSAADARVIVLSEYAMGVLEDVRRLWAEDGRGELSSAGAVAVALYHYRRSLNKLVEARVEAFNAASRGGK